MIYSFTFFYSQCKQSSNFFFFHLLISFHFLSKLILVYNGQVRSLCMHIWLHLCECSRLHAVRIFFIFCRPLHIAAKNGLVPVVQDLISKGGSVLALDENGKILIPMYFVRPRNLEISRSLSLNGHRSHLFSVVFVSAKALFPHIFVFSVQGVCLWATHLFRCIWHWVSCFPNVYL